MGTTHRENRRRRRRPAARLAVWGKFHQWVHDDAVQAIVIHGSRALYVLKAGAWQGLPTPFVRDQQVRELVRRLALTPRRTAGPLYSQLPEGFELFAWQADDGDSPVVLLRRLWPSFPEAARLESFLHEDAASVRLLARRLERREPVLVCGPGQHAREQVLSALAQLLAPERRVVWLVERQHPPWVAGAAAVITVDTRRLYTEPGLAALVLEQAAALAPDCLVIQEAPAPLLAAAQAWLSSARCGLLAASAFPLQRMAQSGRGGGLWARSQDVPESFCWIVEVAGYRRPVVAGIWKALPGGGPQRWWRRLPAAGERSRATSTSLRRGAAADPRTWLGAHKAAEETAVAYAGEAGPDSRR